MSTFALAFILRSLLQLRRTGATGFRGISGAPGSIEWFAGVLFVVALALGLIAPVLQLAGTVDPVNVLDGTVSHMVGFVLFGIGLLRDACRAGGDGLFVADRGG